MTFYKKLLFALVVLATGFSGGVFAQIWFSPTPAEAGNGRIFQGDHVYLYGPGRNPRLQMGTYSQSGEKGLPFIGLSDNKGKLRFLFRLYGQNESPVLIFKDTRGQDRMVLGLGFSAGDEAPFIASIDESGEKHSVMGNYRR